MTLDTPVGQRRTPDHPNSGLLVCPCQLLEEVRELKHSRRQSQSVTRDQSSSAQGLVQLLRKAERGESNLGLIFKRTPK